MEQNKVNSLLPLGVNQAVNAVNSVANNVAKNTARLANNLPKMSNITGIPSLPWLGIVIFTVLVLVFIVLLHFFNQQIREGYDKLINSIRGALGYSTVPPPPVEITTPTTAPPAQEPIKDSDTVVEKILPPGGSPQVFNVSKNKFTFYDAEPLCRALGAELATYEQVKEAWEKGADWCNYGWVKGQMAVYPTQKETWEKLQAGPEEQRLACGNPGLNGGYFDNPELRYGVNCYGSKPSQSSHDATKVAKGTPQSPGELIFDKKVAQYRSEADNIGVLPFNSNKWSS
jgi:hypothetical protein